MSKNKVHPQHRQITDLIEEVCEEEGLDLEEEIVLSDENENGNEKVGGQGRTRRVRSGSRSVVFMPLCPECQLLDKYGGEKYKENRWKRANMRLKDCLHILKPLFIYVLIGNLVWLPMGIVYGFFFNDTLIHENYAYLAQILVAMTLIFLPWGVLMNFWYNTPFRSLPGYIAVGGVFFIDIVVVISFFYLTRAIYVRMMYVSLFIYVVVLLSFGVWKECKTWKTFFVSMYLMILPVLLGFAVNMFMDFLLVRRYIDTDSDWMKSVYRMITPIAFNLVLVWCKMLYRRMRYKVRDFPGFSVMLMGIGALYGRNFTYGIRSPYLVALSSVFVGIIDILIRVFAFNRQKLKKYGNGFPRTFKRIVFHDFSHDDLMSDIIFWEAAVELTVIIYLFAVNIIFTVNNNQLISLDHSVLTITVSFIIQFFLRMLFHFLGSYIYGFHHISIIRPTLYVKNWRVIGAYLVVSGFYLALTLSRVLKVSAGTTILDT